MEFKCRCYWKCANYLEKNGWKRDGLILTDLAINNNEKTLEMLSAETYKPHTKYIDLQT